MITIAQFGPPSAADFSWTSDVSDAAIVRILSPRWTD